MVWYGLVEAQWSGHSKRQHGNYWKPAVSSDGWSGVLLSTREASPFMRVMEILEVRWAASSSLAARWGGTGTSPTSSAKNVDVILEQPHILFLFITVTGLFPNMAVGVGKYYIAYFCRIIAHSIYVLMEWSVLLFSQVRFWNCKKRNGLTAIINKECLSV